MRAAAPIVKWVGGKTKLLPELRARLPGKYKRYYEPFAGGAALFFSLGPQDGCLGDMNEALIMTYTAVADCTSEVVDDLENHKRRHREDDAYYYTVRDAWNEGRWVGDHAGRAAAFIYLNKTCFNGLWRVNRAGQFNVPKGDYKDPTIFDKDMLLAAAAVLRGTELLVGGYDVTSEPAQAGDFVYFDPPYDPVSKTSNFTSYTKDAFGKDHQKALAEHARKLKDRGVFVMLSNNDTSYVRSLYEDFCIDNVKCARPINSKGDKRGQVDEVIITSYERTS